VWVHWGLMLIGVALIARVRAPLVERYQAAPAADQVSLLLSPEYTVLLSLGHREALADMLFANTLVQYGISFQEKQRFDAAYRYLDTITTLAPGYARPYLYADTLLTMRPSPATLDDYLDARRIQERGLEALPFHTELWSVAGQFAAYLAPPYLPESYRADFKRAGARDLTRACELASNNANIPYHCITAAKMLNRSGQREAMMRMLSSTLAVNDDPEVRRMALGYLAQASDDRLRERFARRGNALEAEWKASLPHASRNLLSLLGPGPKIWKCAGAAASRSAGCYTSWRDWGEMTDAAE
jgi:tetratricopeptide (TPR) repeat protein